MIELPHRLIGRPTLVRADVSSLLDPLRALINGQLAGSHFSRKAGIRNDQKAMDRSVLVVQAQVVGGAGGTTVRLTCLAPPRDAAAKWQSVGFTYHANHVEGGSPADGPFSGTVHYQNGAMTFSFVDKPCEAPILTALGDFTDPDTGHVMVDVDITGGSTVAGVVHVLTAWFLAPHRR